MTGSVDTLGVEVYVLTMRHSYSPDYGCHETSETVVGVFGSVEECNKAIVARHFTGKVGTDNPENRTIEISIGAGDYVITKTTIQGTLRLSGAPAAPPDHGWCFCASSPVPTCQCTCRVAGLPVHLDSPTLDPDYRNDDVPF